MNKTKQKKLFLGKQFIFLINLNIKNYLNVIFKNLSFLFLFFHAAFLQQRNYSTH